MVKAKNRIAGIFFYLMMILIPLFFENRYFNMSQAKSHIYVLGSFFLLLAFGLVSLLGIGDKEARRKATKKNGQSSKKVKNSEKTIELQAKNTAFNNITEKALILFALIAILSTFLSTNVIYALWGTKGWNVGGYTLATLVLVYFILSRYLQVKESRFLAVILVNLVIFLIGILHSMGVDLLSFHEHIYEQQWFDYLSTIGHKNWLVGYLCLLLPFFYVSFVTTGEKKQKIAYGLVLELGLFNLFLCDSDGVFLGLCVCGFFAIPFAMKKLDYAKDTLLVLAGCGLALLAIGFLPLFSRKRATMDGIAEKMIHSPIGILFLLMGIAGLVILGRMNDKGKLSEDVYEKKRKILIYLFEIIVGVIFILFVGYSALHFDDSWGSYRGEIWKASFEAFGRFGMKNKLIGLGPEMVEICYRELSEHRSLVVLAAHSEPIQILLSTGLAGFLAWLTVWGSVIWQGMKNSRENENIMRYFLPLMAYLGQSMINSPITTNVAILCVMGALLAKKLCIFSPTKYR